MMRDYRKQTGNFGKKKDGASHQCVLTDRRQLLTPREREREREADKEAETDKLTDKDKHRRRDVVGSGVQEKGKVEIQR